MQPSQTVPNIAGRVGARPIHLTRKRTLAARPGAAVPA
jgi:hypothetical protein